MGGDHAPASVIQGASLALVRFPELKFIIFGNEAVVQPLLDACPKVKSSSEFIHAEDIITSEQKPSAAIRNSKNTSMGKAIAAVKEGKACGVVSAGNTGALMAIAKLALRMIPGIHRPAIAALIPTMRGDCVMLDMGANVECDGEALMQFAVMGDAFARAVLGLSSPRIGLLNVGSEEAKGHDEVKEAYILLRALSASLNFHGFVEGDDIGKGTVDVIVTDGFSGNIALKTAEGTAKMITHFMKSVFGSSLMSRLGYLFARPALISLREALDPRKYNGAMFLGLNGIVVKSHGGTDAYGFSQAIAATVELAQYDINQRILNEMKLAQSIPHAVLEAVAL